MNTFDGIIPTPEDDITKQHIMRYVFAAQFVHRKAVLDIACGAGYGTQYLGACGATTVVGVDVSFHAVSYAKNTYNEVYFLQGDALHLPFEDNFFDVVVSFETIEHIKEYNNYVKEMKRVLTPDGVFICSTPNKNYTRHPAYHVKEFLPEEFFQVLTRNFAHVEQYAQFISVATRIKDVLQLKEKCYSVAKKVLSSSFPGMPLLRTMIKKTRVDTPLKISHEFAVYPVKPLSCKKFFELVRIMVAVCKVV